MLLAVTSLLFVMAIAECANAATLTLRGKQWCYDTSILGKALRRMTSTNTSDQFHGRPDEEDTDHWDDEEDDEEAPAHIHDTLEPHDTQSVDDEHDADSMASFFDACVASLHDGCGPPDEHTIDFDDDGSSDEQADHDTAMHSTDDMEEGDDDILSDSTVDDFDTEFSPFIDDDDNEDDDPTPMEVSAPICFWTSLGVTLSMAGYICPAAWYTVTVGSILGYTGCTMTLIVIMAITVEAIHAIANDLTIHTWKWENAACAHMMIAACNWAAPAKLERCVAKNSHLTADLKELCTRCTNTSDVWSMFTFLGRRVCHLHNH